MLPHLRLSITWIFHHRLAQAHRLRQYIQHDKHLSHHETADGTEILIMSATANVGNRAIMINAKGLIVSLSYIQQPSYDLYHTYHLSSTQRC